MNDKYIIDELFDDATTQIEALKCDIYELDGNYHIEIDVPGFNKQSLKVEYNSEKKISYILFEQITT